jgi:hypothetical protein
MRGTNSKEEHGSIGPKFGARRQGHNHAAQTIAKAVVTATRASW